MSNAINLGAVAYAIRVNLEGTEPKTISAMARAMEQLARAGKDLPSVFKQIDSAIGQGSLAKFLDQFSVQMGKLDFSQLRVAVEQINRFTASLGQIPAPLQQAGTGVAAVGQKIQQFANTTHQAASTVRTDSQQMAASFGTAAQAADNYAVSLEKIHRGLGALARAESAKSISQSAAANDALSMVGRRTWYAERQRAMQEYQEREAKIRKGLGTLARVESARSISQSGAAFDVLNMARSRRAEAMTAQEAEAAVERMMKSRGRRDILADARDVREGMRYENTAGRDYLIEQKNIGEQTEKNAAATDKASGSLHNYASALTAVGYAMAASGLDKIGDTFQNIATESTILAGRVDVLQTVLHNVGANVGYTRGELDVMENKIKSLGITTQSARESLTLLARNELDLAKSGQLARLSQDAAVIAGENSSEAFEKIAIAIQRLDTRLLRNRGIMINLRQLYQQHALETGRVETTLTAQEKQQILLNAVLETGAQIYGTYEASMNDVSKQWYTLDRLIEEASRKIGEHYQPAFRLLVETMTESLNYFDQSPRVQTMTAAILAGSTASVRLGQGVLSAGSAMLSFVWMADMAKQSMKNLQAETTLTGRLVGMFASIISNPVPFLALIGVVGAATGAIAYYIAQVERQKREMEAAKVAAIEYTDRIVEMQEAIQGLDEAVVTYDETAAAQARLNTSLQELLLTAGPYEQALRRIWTETRSYVEVLNAAKDLDPSLGMSSDQLVRQFESTIERLRAQRRELELLGEVTDSDSWLQGIGKWFVSNAALDTQGNAASAREARQEALAYIDNQIDAQQEGLDKLGASRQRYLQQLLDRQEVALGLALRAESQLQAAREKLYDDSHLKILENVQEFNKKLNSSYMTMGQILEHARLQGNMQIAATFRSYEKKIKEATGEDREQLITERDNAVARQLESINKSTQQNLQDRRKIVEMQRSVYELAEKELKVEQDKTRLMREQSDLREKFLANLPPLPLEVGTEDANEAQRALEIAEKEQEFASRRLKIQQEIRAEQERMTLAREAFNKKLQGDQGVSPQALDEAKAAEEQARRIYEEAKATFERVKGGLREEDREKESRKLAEMESAWQEQVSRVNDAQLAYDELATGLDDLIASTTKAIAKLRELGGAEAEIAELENRLAKYTKDRAAARETMTEAENRHKETLRQSALELAEVERQTVRERIRLQEELVRRIRDLSKDETAYTAEEARKRLEVRYNEFEQVRDFIRKERIDLLDARVGGVGQAADIYQSYAEQVIKATSADQLTWLARLAKQRFAGVLQEVRGEMAKANQEYAQAKTPQEAQAALQKLATLQRQYQELSRYVVQFGGQLTKDITKRREELGKVQQEREKEIDLVESVLEKSKEQLANIKQQRLEEEGKVAALREELAVREAVNAQLQMAAALDKQDEARGKGPEARKAAQAGVDVAWKRLLAADRNLEEARGAGRAAREAAAGAARGGAVAQHVPAQAPGQPAQANGAVAAQANGAVAAQGGVLAEDNWAMQKPLGDLQKFLPLADDAIADLERKLPGLPPKDRAQAVSRLKRLRSTRDTVRQALKQRRENMLAGPPERGQFAEGAGGFNEWAGAYGEWASRRPTDRVEDYSSRVDQAANDTFAEAWRGAKTWKERNQIMRDWKKAYGKTLPGRKKWAFEQGQADKQWAFKNFGPGMRNPFPQIPVNPPAQLPNAQENLIEAPLNQQERAKAEVQRAEGEVKAAMGKFQANAEQIIQIAQSLTEAAVGAKEKHQQNVADAERVIGMLQQLA